MNTKPIDAEIKEDVEKKVKTVEAKVKVKAEAKNEVEVEKKDEENVLIIGIRGKAGAGKDTMADHLEKNYGFKKMSFATALKRIIVILTGWSYEFVNGSNPELRPLRETLQHPFYKMTCRQLMQFIGTDLLRNQLNADVWIESVRNEIAEYVKTCKTFNSTKEAVTEAATEAVEKEAVETQAVEKEAVSTEAVETEASENISFETALKRIIVILTGWSYEFVNGSNPELRPLLETLQHPFYKMTCQQLMQFIGTDLLSNQLNAHVWIESVRSNSKDAVGSVASIPSSVPQIRSEIVETRESVEDETGGRTREKAVRIVFTDARFPNEVDMIQSLGGSIFKVVRPGITSLSDETQKHISEADFFVKGEYTILNDGLLSDFISRIDNLRL
jgi:cytidylate kinase